MPLSRKNPLIIRHNEHTFGRVCQHTQIAHASLGLTQHGLLAVHAETQVVQEVEDGRMMCREDLSVLMRVKLMINVA